MKQQYEISGLIPELRDPKRKRKHLDPKFERIIFEAYAIYKSGPVILEKIIRIRYGYTLPHNTIYRVMLMHQLAIETPRKKDRREWVRFEREHSMSIWRGDWKEFKFNGSKNGLLCSLTIHPD